MNTQTLIDRGMKLPVMEMFYTLQGEGHHTGKPAFFVRIGGCDVGCHWCDVKESWKASMHPLYAIEDIIFAACQTGTKAVVITGGEPMLYNLEKLTNGLKEKGLTLFVETSGTSPTSGRFDWICLSPKKQQPPLPYFLQNAGELKMIIHEEADFVWAEDNAKQVHENCLLYLQPEWSVAEEMTPLIIDYIKKNTRWSLSVQTHKFLNIP